MLFCCMLGLLLFVTIVITFFTVLSHFNTHAIPSIPKELPSVVYVCACMTMSMDQDRQHVAVDNGPVARDEADSPPSSRNDSTSLAATLISNLTSPSLSTNAGNMDPIAMEKELVILHQPMSPFFLNLLKSKKRGKVWLLALIINAEAMIKSLHMDETDPEKYVLLSEPFTDFTSNPNCGIGQLV